MGFEVNHTKLIELGVQEWAPYLGFDGTGEFLLDSILTVLRRTSTNTSVRSLPFRAWDMT